MDLLEQTKQLCKMYEIKPARSKGQNFLIDEESYDAIIRAADLKKDDTVLEVGPGLGFLTAILAKIVKRVVSVELDDKLAGLLQIALDSQGVENVEVVNQDVMKFEISDLFPLAKGEIKRGYKIVANLPYNITSQFLRKFLSEVEIKPESIVLMLQKEVVERITAGPGEMSLLAVSVQFYAEAELVEVVKAENFWPAPKIDSAIVRLKLKEKIPLTPLIKGAVDEKDFFRLVKFGFSARRKMLKNNLAGGLHMKQGEIEEKIKKIGLDPKIRAQDLSMEDWMGLYKEFYQ